MGRVAHQLEEKERTRDIEIDENVTFTDLLLSEHVLAGLHAAGFRRPSPIQLAAIPLGRCGLDLVVQAKSGTGKTCVLAVVALEAVSAASPATQAVVVAPTREIAVQVAQVVSTLASAMPGLSAAVFIGGTKLSEDQAKLRQCQVVVGTPGRLAQLVSLGHLQLRSVRLLVLDEADRLLEGGFLAPVTELAWALPLNKQVLCLSATFSDSAAAQAERLMRSPSHVRLDRESPALLGVNQVVRRLASGNAQHMRHAAKEAELLRLLSNVAFNQCLVFSGSQFRAESVCHRLKREGWPAAHLTAAQCQTERLAALEALCSHRCRVLVATDLAARGLDSAHVNLVVSLDLPPDPATYLHRAGRAGRFGSRGAAVMLVCGPDEWYGVRALATLANVRVLLAGPKWASHLSTKKVEAWRRQEEVVVEETEEGKERRVEKLKEEKERRVEKVEEEEEGVRKTKEEKERRVEKMEEEEGVRKTKEEKEGTVEKLEEEEGVSKTEDERRAAERSEQGEAEEVTRLEEVDPLGEEEARAWLKAHKPYRKEPGVKEAPKDKGVLLQENTKKPAKGASEKARNDTGGEANYEIDAQIPTDHEVTKQKVRNTKKQSHRGTTNHRNGRREDVEEEEKENIREDRDRNKSDKHTHKLRIKKQTEASKRQQGQENTGNQGNKLEDTETKATVMSLVSRTWHRPPPVTMSYSHLLSQCTAQYDACPSPDTDIQVKVPPWPKVEASERELAALERYLDGLKEEARERKRVPDGVSFDALAVLQAVTEGKDACVLLGDVTEEASGTPDSSFDTPHNINDDRSSTGTADHTVYTPPKDNKQLSSSNKIKTKQQSTKEQKHRCLQPCSTEDSSRSSSDSEISSSSDHKHHTQPSHPSKQQPSHPSQQQPPYPSKQQPSHPSKQQPSYPSKQQPPYPSKQQPSYPSKQQPSYPSKQQPSHPSKQQPSYPSKQQPPYPSKQQPSYPSKQQPYPSKQQPSYPSKQQPSYPPGQQPSYPSEQQPSYPSKEPPCYPSKLLWHPVGTDDPAVPHPQTEPPHSATGTRPKESRQARKKQGQHSKKSEPCDPTYHQDLQGNQGYNNNQGYTNNNNQEYTNNNNQEYTNNNNQEYSNNYQGYNQWYPGYEQGYQDYNQTYAGYNQQYQDYNKTQPTYEQGNQDSYNQGSHNQAYPNYNTGYPQAYNYNPGYSYDPGQGYPQHTTPAAHSHTLHTYTHTHAADAYIKSACKFASMMEYVSTMGRVSMHVAQDYHSRRKQWREKQ